MGRKRKYFTEEERKAAHIKAVKRWQKNNSEKVLEASRHSYLKNKEKIAENRKTKKGRALCLLKNYKWLDKLYSRGECTLTADWIIQNIFNQPCHYCGKTDWTKIGCDRIDNSLPHTSDNVVPCCCECNRKKARYSYDEYMKMIGKAV